MLEYAYLKNSKVIVNINDVPNGLRCNCECIDCGDILVAKNQCVDKTNHFAHYTKEEQTSCLMTQLHALAQHHFLSVEKVKLPSVSFLYKGRLLTKEETEVLVYKAELEASVGKYSADVRLETSIGVIIIEILVTHKTEIKKSHYYREHKIPTVEYDLSKFRSTEIDLAIDALEHNRLRFHWIYEWCRDALIEECERLIENERQNLQRRRLRSAKDSARKLIKGNYVVLPSIKTNLKHTINNRVFEEEVFLFSRQNKQLDTICIIEETDTYLLLQGKLGHHHIWVAYLLEESIPEPLQNLEGSVVIRETASDVGQKATWSWLKHPSNKNRYQDELEKFKARCLSEIEAEVKTQKAEEIAKIESRVYITSTDLYFKSDYKVWSSWMVTKRLFNPSTREHPKLPSILKYKRSYPSLWMFNTWHILTLSYLAEIVDQHPLNIPIQYSELFFKLTEEIGISKDFHSLEYQVHPSKVKTENRALIIRKYIIESALEPYMMDMKIDFCEKGVIRKGKLMDSLRV